ncbi:hypothetical protein [Dysosmobacter sp. Sow4_B12]|uniref:hypothetical protein n=1 Tax=Dysosmobacter sp. Sow4_B12 TaxID=3438777 RepID=UPI003F8DF8E6
MARTSILPKGKILAKAEFTSAEQDESRGAPMGRAACHGEIAAQGDDDAFAHDKTTSQKYKSWENTVLSRVWKQ